MPAHPMLSSAGCVSGCRDCDVQGDYTDHRMTYQQLSRLFPAGHAIYLDPVYGEGKLPFIRKTHESMMDAARANASMAEGSAARKAHAKMYGMEGIPVLAGLPYWNMVYGHPPEVMHILLGIGEQYKLDHLI